jgi:hypothetical protein
MDSGKNGNSGEKAHYKRRRYLTSMEVKSSRNYY